MPSTSKSQREDDSILVYIVNPIACSIDAPTAIPAPLWPPIVHVYFRCPETHDLEPNDSSSLPSSLPSDPVSNTPDPT